MAPANKSAYPPGPKGLPFIGVLPKMWKDPINYLSGIAAEYGDIATVDFGSRKAFLLNRPEDIRYVLRDNYRNYHKSSTVSVTNRVLGKGLATNEGEFWRKQRQLMQPAFHRQKVANLADQMTAVTEAFLETWAQQPETQIDIHAKLMHLTLNIIIKTMFGSQVENVEELGIAWTTVLNYFNAQSWALLRLPDSWPTPAKRHFNAALQLLDDTVNQIVAERRQGKSGDDLLQLLLAAQDEDTGEGMSDAQLRDEIMTVFLAGHETSAIGLSWALYLLAENTDKLAIFRQEVDRVLKGRTATFADLDNLPYSRMVLEEAMRLFPPFWLVYRSPVEPDEIGGYTLSQKEMVFICPAIVHRLPAYWSDPDLFEPDRFSPDKKKPSQFVYFPFGAGPRMCIGNEFALLEMRLALASIVARFDFQLLPEYPVVPEANVTLRPKNGLHMVLMPRL